MNILVMSNRRKKISRYVIVNNAIIITLMVSLSLPQVLTLGLWAKFMSMQSQNQGAGAGRELIIITS